MKFLTYTLFFLLGAMSYTFAQKYVIAAYYPDWMYEDLPAEHILYSNITHLIHFSVWPDSKGNIASEENFIYPDVIKLSHKNNIKVLLAVGGNERSQNFVRVASNPSLKKRFLDNLVKFLIDHDYDGIDWDWEFPENSSEGDLYLNLIKELRIRLDKLPKKYLMTLATSSGNWIGQHFDYAKMEKYLDWFYLMSYDYHGSWLDHTGHNAPLFPHANEQDGSVKESVEYLKNTRGISSQKIVLGIPFYGRIYKSEGLNKKFTSVSNINYSEVDSLIVEGWKRQFDTRSKVPYLLNRSEKGFVTYEDKMSIGHKTKFVKQENLAGVMIWSMGQDLVNGEQQLLQKIGSDFRMKKTKHIPEVAEIPKDSDRFVLFNNDPNPFYTSTQIEYLIPKTNRRILPVTLKVYDSDGREIAILVDRYHKPGRYKVEFSGAGLKGGSYFYELVAGDFSAKKEMELIKKTRPK